MWPCAIWQKFTDISEGHTASTFRQGVKFVCFLLTSCIFESQVRSGKFHRKVCRLPDDMESHLRRHYYWAANQSTFQQMTHEDRCWKTRWSWAAAFVTESACCFNALGLLVLKLLSGSRRPDRPGTSDCVSGCHSSLPLPGWPSKPPSLLSPSALHCPGQILWNDA